MKVKQKVLHAINDAKGLYFINAQREKMDKPTQIWTHVKQNLLLFGFLR